MKQMKHWQDPVNALLGAWLILAPWALGFQAERVAMLDFTVVGVLLVAAALGAIFLAKAWEEWAEVVFGICLMASPWILGFSHVTMAVQAALFTGIAVVVLALWVLATDDEYSGWWHRLVG